jgi:diacylglycerol kinase (ATP)
MTAWWVVVNPGAGRGHAREERVVAALSSRSVEYKLRVSDSAEAIRSIVAEGRDLGYTRFVAVGGDGTANLVLNALCDHDWESPPTLGILPAGSGSDFVRTFGIPNDLEQAADHLVSDMEYAVDVGLLSGAFGTRYFLNAANTGIAARTVVEAKRFPDWMGSRRYIAGFWSALARTNPSDVSVDCDGRTINALAWNVVIANGQFFGGGMNVAPRAAAMDGRFDVQVFSGSRRSAPAVLRRVVRGTHLTHRAVRRTTGAVVVVDVPEAWLVEADGEIVGAGPFTAEIRSDRLVFKI